jgi:hypothetical protein
VARRLSQHTDLPVTVDDDPDCAYWQQRHTLLVTNRKLGAALYVDDRALRFTGDWTATLADVACTIGQGCDIGRTLARLPHGEGPAPASAWGRALFCVCGPVGRAARSTRSSRC